MAESDAYYDGYDAGLNGPNTRNCNFAIFSDRKATGDWERGVEAGKREKQQREKADAN